MLVDAGSADRALFAREFDVCVIGAGPAGITLARRMAAAGARVALMEGGGAEPSARSRALHEGENIGLDYFPLDITRVRCLGGSSNHWGGWCRALDHLDFTPAPHNPLSGWPIARVELDRYRAEADAILDLPPASEFPDLPVIQTGHDFRRIQFRFSAPPTNFREKFGAELAAAPGILLALNANLVDLRLDPGHGQVTAAVFRGYDPADPGFEIEARHYCLATGGIENPRLLLNFRSQEPAGIGNRFGLVGRFFCEHPHFELADVLLPGEPLPRTEFYMPTEAFALDKEVLNFGLRFGPGPWPPTHPASAARVGLADTPFALQLLEFMREEERPPRRAVSSEHLPLAATARLMTAQEQALNPDSRVRIDEDRRDALGLAPVQLDWRLSALDLHTMRTSAIEFGRHLAETGRGRLRLRDWLRAEDVVVPGTDDDAVAGHHHMCTTRMADDPRHGVVDADCRVHGLANLYVAGSSVFATPGHANPTYTIVQLALRLGDHLAARLQG